MLKFWSPSITKETCYHKFGTAQRMVNFEMFDDQMADVDISESNEKTWN